MRRPPMRMGGCAIELEAVQPAGRVHTADFCHAPTHERSASRAPVGSEA